MKTILPLLLGVIVVVLCFAGEPLQVDPGDWRSDITTNTTLAEKLKASKVPTEEEARRKSYDLLTDARSSVRVSSLFRLARADKELGEAGDFVWEVRVLWGRSIADVIWVSASTGSAKRIFPR